MAILLGPCISCSYAALAHQESTLSETTRQSNSGNSIVSLFGSSSPYDCTPENPERVGKKLEIFSFNREQPSQEQLVKWAGIVQLDTRVLMEILGNRSLKAETVELIKGKYYRTITARETPLTKDQNSACEQKIQRSLENTGTYFKKAEFDIINAKIESLNQKWKESYLSSHESETIKEQAQSIYDSVARNGNIEYDDRDLKFFAYLNDDYNTARKKLDYKAMISAFIRQMIELNKRGINAMEDYLNFIEPQDVHKDLHDMLNSEQIKGKDQSEFSQLLAAWLEFNKRIPLDRHDIFGPEAFTYMIEGIDYPEVYPLEFMEILEFMESHDGEIDKKLKSFQKTFESDKSIYEKAALIKLQKLVTFSDKRP